MQVLVRLNLLCWESRLSIKYPLFIFLISLFSLEVQSLSREQVSRDYLVDKLQTLYQSTPSSHDRKKPVTLRLAHILFLRAVDNISKNKSEDCKKCLELGLQDAQRSLALYSELNPYMQSNHPMLYVQSLFKQVYLHSLQNQKLKAISIIKKIIQIDTLSEDLLTRAYFNLGSLYFESYNYDQALQAFNKVLAKQNHPWIFRAHYHKIWSLYNLSHYSEAIQSLEQFLVSSIYQKESSLLEEEKSLRQKLQKELVVLYSRSELTDRQIKFFYNFDFDQKSLNSRDAKNKRLIDLALSLSRIGRAKESAQIWKIYLEKDISSENRVRAYAFLIDSYFLIHDRNWVEKVGDIVQKSFAFQKVIKKCFNNVCGHIQKNQEQYIKRLAEHSQKTGKYKEFLLSLYQSYNNLYPNQSDTLLASAVLAQDLKNYGLSHDLFYETSQAFEKSLKNISDSQKRDRMQKDLEKVRVLQVEMAELSQDQERREKSYSMYIQHGTNKEFNVHTQYQKIYLLYQQKLYKQASSLFKNFALAHSKGLSQKIKDLQLKAAHLALSCLDFLGKETKGGEVDQLMFDWSLAFLKKFPKQKKDFLNIHYTALFNKVKKLVSYKNLSLFPITPSSDPDISKAWELVASADINQMPSKYKNDYYMNKLILAKELLKLDEMNQVISQLMTIKTLPQEDQKMVSDWNLWLAEARFDFYEVLKSVEKNQEDTEEYYLRLARLSELANKDYMSRYHHFLKKFPQSQKSFEVVVHMLNKSLEKEKPKLLKRYNNYFKQNPDLFSYWVLKLDDQNLNTDFLTSFTQFDFMNNSSVKKFIEKRAFVNGFQKALQKARSVSLPANASGKTLANSIARYKKHIQTLESQVKIALESQGWLSQLVAFSGFYGELTRFYDSILGLPLPEGLNPEEQEEYKTLIVQQIQPYKTRADQLKKQLNNMLSKNFIEDYQKLAKDDPVSHGILKWELNQVLSVVEQSQKADSIQSILQSLKTKEVDQTDTDQVKIAHEEIEKIYKRLKKHPFHQEDLKQLLKLEQARNNTPMSYYLKNRLAQINSIQKGQVR